VNKIASLQWLNQYSIEILEQMWILLLRSCFVILDSTSNHIFSCVKHHLGV
jgi:hypothetical protein